ncbi:MAG: monofunctional biosynthetic peptidoglycan transglycosylase [Acidobacteria bacterium]|nr:monofunctional biosynthetic peptidoglycan transglycosylase [Acidobacteriota bacterium]
MRRVGRYIAAAAVFGFGYLAYLYLGLPDVRELRTSNLDRTAFMQLREREARDKGLEPRHIQWWMPYGRISPNLKRAVLVAEDAGFWGHEGIDLIEIRKSLETDWEKGTFLRGASTITQQLAKNLYLNPSRNPFRKLRELFIARRLERELSKTRIFELYLNDIEWGDGIYGADAAARAYFGVPASAITPDQAALMAGAIVNPRELKVVSPNGRLRARQRIIRARMGNVTPPPTVAVPAPVDPVPESGAPTGVEPDAPGGAVPSQAPGDLLPEPGPDPLPPPAGQIPPSPQPFPGATQP